MSLWSRYKRDLRLLLQRIVMKTLLLGYGNVDRQDDGVAWHILAGVGKRLGVPVPDSIEEEFPLSDGETELMFFLQLTPELAETVATYDRVCFIDAHTGHVPNDLNIEPVTGEFQASPFTHHLTPSSCLSLAQALYSKMPEAILVSVRGFQFGFSRELSAETQSLAAEAVESILGWLNGQSITQSYPTSAN